MQSTIPQEMSEEMADLLGKTRHELFGADDEKALLGQMDSRLHELEERGERLLRRRAVDPEEAVETTITTIKSIATASNRYERRRLKKLAKKLISVL